MELDRGPTSWALERSLDFYSHCNRSLWKLQPRRWHDLVYLFQRLPALLYGEGDCGNEGFFRFFFFVCLFVLRGRKALSLGVAYCEEQGNTPPKQLIFIQNSECPLSPNFWAFLQIQVPPHSEPPVASRWEGPITPEASVSHDYVQNDWVLVTRFL